MRFGLSTHCFIRWVQAQEESGVCQLGRRRVWEHRRHRVVGGQARVSSVRPSGQHALLCKHHTPPFVFQGYMTSIDKRVFTYISLDGVVMGQYRSQL